MKNILIDLNILLDYYESERRIRYPDSVEAFDYLKHKEFAFISSSSIDNFEFIKYADVSKSYPDFSRKQRLFIVHGFVKEFLSCFKIAKTPSYLEINYDDIEDSQIIASAKAIDALVLTRDEKMIQRYPNNTITPREFLKIRNQKPETIDFANLRKQYFRYQSEFEKEMDTVLNQASYIMGDAVRELERGLEAFTGAAHAIGCSSGTDALLLAMMALEIGPGDEVITTPFTFIATAETIALLGAKPVFVDIDETSYNIDPSKIEAAITDRTKAIIPVSLYGQPCDLDEIRTVIDKVEGRREKVEGVERDVGTPSSFNLQPSSSIKMIVDGAQSFGATYKGKAEVHWCDIYTTSFFPAKPLGCFGDGGAVLTNDDALAEKMRMLRVHGQDRRYHHKYIGLGARLDTIQAAVLNVKLKHYPEDLAKRQEVAEKYTCFFREQEEGRRKKGEGRGEKDDGPLKTSSSTFYLLPSTSHNKTSAWAQYSIRINASNFQLPTSDSARSELQAKLKAVGIPTAIHYPLPLHLQECFGYLGYREGDFPVAERISREIMSLPMNPDLTEEEICYIAEKVIEGF